MGRKPGEEIEMSIDVWFWVDRIQDLLTFPFGAVVLWLLWDIKKKVSK